MVLAPLVLLVVYVGTVYFNVMVALMVVVLAWEWGRLCAGFSSWRLTLLIAAPALSGLAMINLLSRPDLALGVVAVAGLGVVAVLALRAAVMGTVGRGAWLAGGAVYMGVASLALTWLRAEPELGLQTLFWLLALVWATDIGAYAAGRALGGPRLAPSISPNKTWAGLLGGVAAATAVGTMVAMAFGAPALIWVAVVTAVLAALSQAGDLFESWVKRRFEVKDIGGLIPGHGGLFDRVDGLLAAAIGAACVRVLAGSPLAR